ncbi:MAG: transposase family protein [Candidatus Dojkabacteria bacterium]|nr:transposase family protein [Candidatus Dojkabacteria bacterium]
MIRFDIIKNKPSKIFLRDVGLQLNKFLEICDKVKEYIEEERNKNSLKRRGIKSSYLSIEDKLLVTFYYLRHYITFIKLGEMFGISESYAYKIYKKFLDILIKVLKMPDPKELINADIEMIGIDVTEQEIERPKKKQKEYYSGKKNVIQ